MTTDMQYVTLWCSAMKGRNFSSDTLKNYRRVTRVFVSWCVDDGLTLSTVTHVDIDRWLETKRIGPRSRYAYTSTLASFYAWLLREEHVDHDPTLRVERPRLGRYLPRPAATADVERALLGLEPRVVAMIACGVFAGMRVSEITKLRTEDLLLAKEPPLVLLHGKGGRERLVPLHDALLAALVAHGLPRVGWVFPNPRTGGPLSRTWVGKLIADAFDELGGHVTPHQLRHLFGTLCYEDSDGDLRMTQELLGHQSPSTTAIYTAFSRPRAAQVVRGLLSPRESTPIEAA